VRTVIPSGPSLGKVEYTVFESPLGPLTIFAGSGLLMGVEFGDNRTDFEGPGSTDLERELVRRLRCSGLVRPHSDPAGAVSALRAYFAGDLQALDTLDVDPMGTPFQLRVWNALRSVPAGRTASYRDIANAIGAPASTRAVGAANGANPIAIVVPCHRIIGSGGSLVGYGGGLERKRWLLQHEGVLLRM
jgi:methylated-DNA-[protein]-cysteine S-methyltransferase